MSSEHTAFCNASHVTSSTLSSDSVILLRLCEGGTADILCGEDLLGMSLDEEF